MERQILSRGPSRSMPLSEIESSLRMCTKYLVGDCNITGLPRVLLESCAKAGFSSYAILIMKARTCHLAVYAISIASRAMSGRHDSSILSILYPMYCDMRSSTYEIVLCGEHQHIIACGVLVCQESRARSCKGRPLQRAV